MAALEVNLKVVPKAATVAEGMSLFTFVSVMLYMYGMTLNKHTTPLQLFIMPILALI